MSPFDKELPAKQTWEGIRKSPEDVTIPICIESNYMVLKNKKGKKTS